jgi:molecular chaperone HscB
MSKLNADAVSPSPSKSNYFALFGLPQQFDLSLESLEAQFRRAQAAVHPDKFVGAPAADQRQALNQSMQLNEAAQTLRSDTRRAIHLCELAGITVDLDSNTAMGGPFLVEQMQWREDLDEAKQVALPEAFDSLCTIVNQAALERLQQLKQLFDLKHNPAAAPAVIRELLFIRKLANEIYDALEALDTD